MNLWYKIFALIFILSNICYGNGLHSKGLTIYDEKEESYNKKWYKKYLSDEDNIKILIRVLKKSKRGKLLLSIALKKAHREGRTVWDIIRPGGVSLTDTTLTRKFSLNGKMRITYSESSTIYVNKNLSLFDGVMDLAHELTHFNERRAFNPYQNKFSLSKFISSTIEGKGGEVEAFISECKVFLELFPRDTAQRSDCLNLMDGRGRFSKVKGKKSFYKLGKYYHPFLKGLRKHSRKPETDFPDALSAEPVFISSAYGVPYPLAAVFEYNSIMEKVCENDSARLGQLKKIKGERSPASDEFGQDASIKSMEESFYSRCRHHL